MSFSLSGLLFPNQIQNTNINNTAQSESKAEGSVTVPVTNMLRLANGSQISGEVISVSGKDIIIQIAPDQQLSAKMAANMNVEQGQKMTFEVQKNASGQIALRALYANLDVNPTALKALDMADIPVKENTVLMVDTMMKEGMSIDSDSLQKMYHEIIKNPEASGNTIVQLARIGIPITSENIGQYESYMNLNHKLTGAMQQISSNLTQLTQELFESGHDSEAFSLQKLALDIFAGSDVDWVAEKLITNNTDNANGQTDKETQIIDSGEKQQLLPAEEKQQVLSPGQMQQFLSSKEMDSLLSMTGKLGLTPEITQEIANGNVSAKQFLSLINQIIGQLESGTPAEKQTMRELLQSPIYGKILVNQMSDDLSLKPEEVFEKEKVQQIYDKIQSKMAALAQNMTQNVSHPGTNAESLMQSIGHLQQNLDFMQQINHFANYIQLPLKMNGENKDGELYVYTNKKNLAEKDGNISAFLHLDMTHLGPVDVYVTMQAGNNVNTHFYLATEVLIDFISEHLSILDERLAKRGYHMNATITEKEQDKPFNVLDEIKNEQKEGSVSSKIASYAFDVRA